MLIRIDAFFISKPAPFGSVFFIKDLDDNHMDIDFKPKITIFHCINAFDESYLLPLDVGGNFEVKVVKLACSSMVKDVFLLRAFEAGADAVAVLVCPEGHCRYVEGNIRAKKRIGWVQNLLDEIGLNGKRLYLFNTSAKDKSAIEDIIKQIMSDMAEIGQNPAA